MLWNYKEMSIFEDNMTKNFKVFKSMTHLIQKVQKVPNNISTGKPVSHSVGNSSK